ncbi:hypothetical protein J6Y50_00740 [bacterium]|nr:hypothetical protein [bacterium]
MIENKTQQITKIDFNRSENIFINSGIIALNYYLEKFKKLTDIKYSHNLFENKLVVESEHLMKLLQDVYYFMGKEVYDTSGQRAREDANNGKGQYYFVKEPFSGNSFPKMQSYGLAALITNNATPTAGHNGDKKKLEKLYSEDRDFADKIVKFFADKGIKREGFKCNKSENGEIEIIKTGKIKGEVYLNTPYTKTTNVDDIFKDPAYFTAGENTCSLTGEKFKKLCDSQCLSPFISGLNNFCSNLDLKSGRISAKALYLSRFSPKFAFYTQQGKESVYIYMFVTDNLKHLDDLRKVNSHLYKDEPSLIACNYNSNMKLYNFVKEKDGSKDWTEQNDFLFMLIYSFYKNILKDNNVSDDSHNSSENFNPFAEIYSEMEKKSPISLISFRSDEFAGTMRTKFFEEINNFKWLIRFFAFLEDKKISIYNIMNGLKFIKESERGGKNAYRQERLLRNRVLGKIINGKSILEDIETLFYNCFCQIMANEAKWRSYKDIFDLTCIYEKATLFGGNQKMTETLQEKAINLGKSIGQGILRYGDANDINAKKSNAKAGRTYIISLKKARTLQQFLEEIIRIQTKYEIAIANEILEEINPQNFVMVKQFCIISALNQLNTLNSTIKGEKNNEN